MADTVIIPETVLEIDVDGGGAQIFSQQAYQYMLAAQTAASEAASSQSAASVSEASAESFASNASLSASSAATSETNADESATLSRSWAVGDTETRGGEEENNSKYYSEISKSWSDSAYGAVSDCEDILSEIQTLTAETVFTVNFETGELEYTAPNTTWSINTTTGNLEWEVNA